MLEVAEFDSSNPTQTVGPWDELLHLLSYRVIWRCVYKSNILYIYRARFQVDPAKLLQPTVS